MSDTPRTDAHSLDMESEDFDVELAKTYSFARQLECELKEALKESQAAISAFLGFHSDDLTNAQVASLSETLTKISRIK